MGKLLRWQEEFLKEVEALDNRSFFERMIEEVQPDGFDGDFTDRGAWRADYMQRRIIEKLVEAGWMKQES